MTDESESETDAARPGPNTANPQPEAAQHALSDAPPDTYEARRMWNSFESKRIAATLLGAAALVGSWFVPRDHPEDRSPLMKLLVPAAEVIILPLAATMVVLAVVMLLRVLMHGLVLRVDADAFALGRGVLGTDSAALRLPWADVREIVVWNLQTRYGLAPMLSVVPAPGVTLSGRPRGYAATLLAPAGTVSGPSKRT